jgi:flagellar M-ring protein FliF
MINSVKTQFTGFWKKLGASQRVILVVLVLVLAILVPVLLTWANAPTYAVAFSGLSEADAGTIVQKLTAAGITYQLKNDTTIMVPTDKVYDVRLQMASAGLPSSSSVGFELFDNTTLGMNDFTQQVTYQRALEGELERTIGVMSSISSVRVLLVTPQKSLLSTDQALTTASITLKMKTGDALDKSQIRAITNLVASSVEGLTPENVTVVDSNGALLSGGLGSSADASLLDSQHAAENATAAQINHNIQSMLDRILGPNHSTVQSNVVMDWTQREVTTTKFDPTPAAIRSSQKTNETYTTNGTVTGGVPGASSNLPTPVAMATGVAGVTNYSKTDETVNYELSQVDSKEVVPPGTVSRMTVSVMVDKVTDPQQLSSIKSAVSAAAGIDLTRGDVVDVQTTTFDTTYLDQQASDLVQTQQTDQLVRLIPIGVAAVAFLILLGLVLRAIGQMHKASLAAWQPVLMPVQEMALAAGAAARSVPQISAPSAGMPQGLAATATRMIEENAASEQSRHTTANVEDEYRSKLIKKLTEENPSTVAEVIQAWLGEDGKRND